MIPDFVDVERPTSENGMCVSPTGKLSNNEHLISDTNGVTAFNVSLERQLPVLLSKGIQDTGGILGNDILQLFQCVEFDSSKNVLRLVR